MKTLLHIIWNPKQKRLRSLVRIICQFILMSFVSVLTSLVFLLVFGLPRLSGNTSLMETLSSLSALCGIVISAWLCGRFLDHRPFKDFGFHFGRRWWKDFIFGLFLGAFLMGGIFILELSAGWIDINSTFVSRDEWITFPVGMFLALVFLISVGIQEELLFRGYYLQNLAEGLDYPKLAHKYALALAWMISSIVFGLAHAVNPNASIISTINIVLAGLFLGLGFVLTGELAIPIGLHITWNFFQGIIFGFPVSGLTPFVSVFHITQAGPKLWTGGAFGPEAGLMGLLVMVVGSGISLIWIRYMHGEVSLAGNLADYKL